VRFKRVYLLCAFLFLVSGVFAEEPEYLKWIKQGRKGNVEKQYLAGLAYYKGIGGAQKDYKKAYKWFEFAARNGSLAAYVSLGDMHFFGYLSSADEKKAFDWYLKAAKKGNAEAMEKIGDMYLHSRFLGQNYFEAAKWYKRAAGKSVSPGASSKLARLYYLGGKHFNRDEKKALKYFLRAFELGDYNVAHYISGIYEDNGDYEKAAQWLVKGAENGSPIAMYYLAKAYGGLREYSEKSFIKLDYVQAYKWLYILAKKEYQPRYEKDLSILTRKMEKSEVRKAKKLAAPLLQKLVSEEDLKWSKYSKKHPSEMK